MKRDVLRRSVILPSDLYGDVERVAQADHFASVQAWVVCTLQRLVNARRELQDSHTRVSTKTAA